MVDWQDQWNYEPEGFVLGVLVLQGDQSEESEGADYYSSIAARAKQLTDADASFATYIDPGVGASGYGVGLLLEFLDVGADVIAWGTAAMALAPRLKKLIAELKARPDVSSVQLLPDALQVLVVAEVIGRSGVSAREIEIMHRQVFEGPAGEPRIELKQLDSCTVFVLSHEKDYYRQIWTYVVTSSGRVISDSLVELPYYPVSLWKEEVIEKRMLNGL
ncbi:MAG: hypothetical protein AAFU38_14720 [Bacteroidota bacterium]